MNPKEITNNRLLSNYLRLDIKELNKLIVNDYSITSVQSNEVLEIIQYKLPKRKGGARIVYSPNSDTLTNCLKVLNGNLKKIFTPSDYVHGYVKGRSIKTNASKHLSKRNIYKVDIKDFFGSISIEMIVEILNNYGFKEDVSTAIAKIVTFENKLVQGFHTSPTIANMCFNEIDLELAAIDKDVCYTRYADDLYFSSDKDFDIEANISEILKKSGFVINTTKTKIMRRGGKQFVTGLTVFDDQYPRIPKYIKRNFRQQIYYISKYGYKGHILHKLGISVEEYKLDAERRSQVDGEMQLTNSRIYGWLRYLNSIEPKFAQKCYLELDKKFKKYS